MKNVTDAESTHHAAILLKGGKQDWIKGSLQYDECQTFAHFDFWKYTEDFEEIMAAPGDRLVMGESKEEVAQLLEAKYPNPHGLSMLLAGNQHIATSEDSNQGWRRRRRYDTERMDGWRVMDRPVVTKEDWETEEELQSLSMEYGGVWLDYESYSALGDERGARNKGFVPSECIGEGGWHSDWTFIRYNPRNYQNKAWRAEKERIEKLLIGQYPDMLIRVIGNALSPGNWPSRRGFPDIVTWNGREEPHKLLELIAYARKYGPKRPFWRKYNDYDSRSNMTSFKSAVDQMLIYSYGVIDQAKASVKAKDTKRWHSRKLLEFTNWLLSEAKALKLKMPDRPTVPPRPENPFSVKSMRKNALRVVDLPDVEVPILPAAVEEPATPTPVLGG